MVVSLTSGKMRIILVVNPNPGQCWVYMDFGLSLLLATLAPNYAILRLPILEVAGIFRVTVN